MEPTKRLQKTLKRKLELTISITRIKNKKSGKMGRIWQKSAVEWGHFGKSKQKQKWRENSKNLLKKCNLITPKVDDVRRSRVLSNSHILHYHE